MHRLDPVSGRDRALRRRPAGRCGLPAGGGRVRGRARDGIAALSESGELAFHRRGRGRSPFQPLQRRQMRPGRAAVGGNDARSTSKPGGALYRIERDHSVSRGRDRPGALQRPRLEPRRHRDVPDRLRSRARSTSFDFDARSGSPSGRRRLVSFEAGEGLRRRDDGRRRGIPLGGALRRRCRPPLRARPASSRSCSSFRSASRPRARSAAPTCVISTSPRRGSGCRRRSSPRSPRRADFSAAGPGRVGQPANAFAG